MLLGPSLVPLLALVLGTRPGLARGVKAEQVDALAQQIHARHYADLPLATGVPTDTVETVVKRLVRQLPGKAGKHTWAVRVVAGEQAEAVALPNGQIVVYAGLLPVAKTEGGLAAALGHLLAHVAEGHGQRRIEGQLVVPGLVAADQIGDPVGIGHDKYGSTLTTALGAGGALRVVSPYLRDLEAEADVEGLHLMAKAGYDPAAATLFWARVREITNDSGVRVLGNNHPMSLKRSRTLEEAVVDAERVYDKAKAQYGRGVRIDR